MPWVGMMANIKFGNTWWGSMWLDALIAVVTSTQLSVDFVFLMGLEIS